MRLSLTRGCEYGMRVMTYLANQPAGTRITSSELGDLCEVPPGNVPTVVSRLSRARLLDAAPGRSGGCSLARDAAEITVLEIVEALEGSLDVDHCLLDSRRCHDHAPECALHEVWSTARASTLGALAKTSLAAVAARELELQSP